MNTHPEPLAYELGWPVPSSPLLSPQCCHQVPICCWVNSERASSQGIESDSSRRPSAREARALTTMPPHPFAISYFFYLKVWRLQREQMVAYTRFFLTQLEGIWLFVWNPLSLIIWEEIIKSQRHCKSLRYVFGVLVWTNLQICVIMCFYWSWIYWNLGSTSSYVQSAICSKIILGTLPFSPLVHCMFVKNIIYFQTYKSIISGCGCLSQVLNVLSLCS